LALKSATWFYEHLGGQKPIVVVTEDDAIINHYKNERREVFVLKLGDYLQDFWPSLSPESKDVYAGLVEVKRAVAAGETTGGKQEDYRDYYKSELVQSGLRQGRLFKGRLCVDKHHAGQEAVVISRYDILTPSFLLYMSIFAYHFAACFRLQQVGKSLLASAE
jgi:hypothetical protein